MLKEQISIYLPLTHNKIVIWNNRIKNGGRIAEKLDWVDLLGLIWWVANSYIDSFDLLTRQWLFVRCTRQKLSLIQTVWLMNQALSTMLQVRSETWMKLAANPFRTAAGKTLQAEVTANHPLPRKPQLIHLKDWILVADVDEEVRIYRVGLHHLKKHKSLVKNSIEKDEASRKSAERERGRKKAGREEWRKEGKGKVK